MGAHAISVLAAESGFKWECQCGAKGNAHEKHQTALALGLQHLEIERPVEA